MKEMGRQDIVNLTNEWWGLLPFAFTCIVRKLQIPHCLTFSWLSLRWEGIAELETNK